MLRGVCMSVRVLCGGGECSGVEWEIDCNEHSFRRCGIYSVDLRHYLCVARAARAEVESSRRFHLQARADQADELTLRYLAFRSSLICFIWQYDSSIRCTDTPPHCVLGFYRAHSVGSGVCRCLPNLLSFAEPSALVQQSEMLSSVWILCTLICVGRWVIPPVPFHASRVVYIFKSICWFLCVM